MVTTGQWLATRDSRTVCWTAKIEKCRKRPVFLVRLAWRSWQGAHPSYVEGAYGRDDIFRAYDREAGIEKGLADYIRRYIYNCDDHAAYIELVSKDRLLQLGHSRAVGKSHERSAIAARLALHRARTFRWRGFDEIGNPSDAALLAKHSRAPEMTLIYESGIVDSDPTSKPPLSTVAHQFLKEPR